MTETPILDERAVEEIEARADKATPPPWECGPTYRFIGAKNAAQYPLGGSAICNPNDSGGTRLYTTNRKNNGEFIAHAREDVPALCATVKYLRAKHEQLALASGEWASLLDRIRAWSKCSDSYPLDEHINNIAVDRERLQSQLEQLRAENEALRKEVANSEKYQAQLLDSDSQIAGREALASVNASAREIIEVVNKTAISLAVCRHGLIREAEDDETVLPDEVEDEIIQDVLECLTGEETGCLDPEELDAENCAVLMVQDRLSRVATSMRDKCVEKVRALAEDYSDAWARQALVVAARDIQSLTLDQMKPGEM